MKTYKTYRGKLIDLEAIRRKHADTVAVGNMGVNARGDKLGPGGEIISSVQEKSRMHYDTTVTSTETVSIKGDMPVDEAGILEDLPIKRATQKKVKERETALGDIIIEEETDESSSTEE